MSRFYQSIVDLFYPSPLPLSLSLLVYPSVSISMSSLHLPSSLSLIDDPFLLECLPLWSFWRPFPLLILITLQFSIEAEREREFEQALHILIILSLMESSFLLPFPFTERVNSASFSNIINLFLAFHSNTRTLLLFDYRRQKFPISVAYPSIFLLAPLYLLFHHWFPSFHLTFPLDLHWEGTEMCPSTEERERRTQGKKEGEGGGGGRKEASLLYLFHSFASSTHMRDTPARYFHPLISLLHYLPPSPSSPHPPQSIVLVTRGFLPSFPPFSLLL